MLKFEKKETELEGVYIIHTVKFEDERGYFSEVYQKDSFRDLGIQENFIQENVSFSKKGTLRGLHFQTKKKQGKLLRVLEGKIYDVIVDLRKESSTYGKYIGIELSSKDQNLLWIPPDFAHGFLSLAEKNVIQYQCTDSYDMEYEEGILWSDQDLNIDWKLDEYGFSEEELIISEKDKKQKKFVDYERFEKEKSILILGGNGQLGKEFQKFLQKKMIEYQAIDKDALDVSNEKKCREFFIQKHYCCVINCAAYTNVDLAEKEKEECKAVNTDAVRIWTKMCEEKEIPFITFSTDMVFDGKDEFPYTEEDMPNPVNWYGKTKLEGEKFALQYSRSLVIRTSWLFSTEGDNFCKKALLWAKNQETLRIVDDQISSPTSVEDIAVFTWKLYQKACFGLYHMSGMGESSKYDQIRYLLSLFSWKGRIERAKTEEFWNLANRPKYSKLCCMKLYGALGLSLPYWKKSIQYFAKNLRDKNLF